MRISLANYLEPETFGLLGIAMSMLAFFTVFSDVGIGAALIQRQSISDDSLVWSTVYWFNLALNGLLAILLFVAAPYVARFFSLIQLSWVLRWFSVTLILNAVSYIYRIRLHKGMNFRAICISTVVANSVGGFIAVAMAMKGFGIACFIVQNLIVTGITCIGFIAFSPWIPRWHFKYRELASLFSFGVYDSAIRIVGFSYNHLNALLLGWLFSSVQVGLYTFSQTFTLSLANPVNNVTKRILFPYFSQVRKSTETILEVHLLQIRFTTLFVYPVAFLLIYVSEYLFTMFWGGKWSGCIWPVRFLTVFLMILFAGGTPSVILKSCGLMKNALILQLIRFFVIKVPLVVVGGMTAGFMGFFCALCISQLLIYFVDYWFVKRAVDIEIKQLVYSSLFSWLSCLPGNLLLVNLFPVVGSVSVSSILLRLTFYLLVYIITVMVCEQVFFVPEKRMRNIIMSSITS